MKSYTNIGEVIKYLREHSKLSQNALSSGICSREYLGKLERGESSPTCEILNLLSNKLGANIYENYALVIEHNGIKTHEHIVEINELIGKKDYATLYTKITEFSQLKGFSHGIPFKYLKYAEALCFGNHFEDYAKAVSVAMCGLETDPYSFIRHNVSTIYLSKADLLLLQSIAVNLCRQEKYIDASLFFDFLIEYLFGVLSSNRYIINRNKRFELNYLSHTVYNRYTFFHNSTDEEYEIIKSTIDALKKHKCSNALPELLFCKSQIEYEKGNIELAHESLSTAQAFSDFLYGKEKTFFLQKEICNPKLFTMESNLVGSD